MTRNAEPDDDSFYIPPGEPVSSEGSTRIQPLVSEGAFHTLASTLTKTQVEAATHRGPILVLAGAGTGKTSTLTAAVVHRIAVDRIPPSRLLAVTFTNKAAAEMTHRIRDAVPPASVPSWIGTFHGLGARQLRDGPEIAGLRPNFEILDADDTRRLVKRTMKEMNLATGDETNEQSNDPLKLMCNRLAKFKDNLITPQGASHWVEKKIEDASHRREPIDAQSLRASARVYAEYQRRLLDGNAADFGDLLLWPTLAMLDNDVIRRGIRTPILGLSASKRDPGIWVQNGHHGMHGGQDRDAGCGDDREDPSRVFCSRHADQGDLPGSTVVAEGRPEGPALGGDGVSLRAVDAADAEGRPLA